MQLSTRQTLASYVRARQPARACTYAALPRSTGRGVACRVAAPEAATEPAVASVKDKAASYIDSFAVPAARAVLEPYAEPEALLCALLALPDLDAALDPAAPAPDADAIDKAARLSRAVAAAMDAAYGPEPIAAAAATGIPESDATFTVADELLAKHDAGGSAGAEDRAAASGPAGGAAGGDRAFETAAAHTFLQRVLYRINRLSHFWYDDLELYSNERSLFLQALRNTIERRWQRWETAQLPAGVAARCAEAGLEEVQEALKQGYARDVDPPHSPALTFIRDEMGPLGYAHLLAIGSVDGLVEASRQSRVCAGTANSIQCAVFRVLSEEYGGGRYARKHSTFYSAMMQEAGLDTREEAYLDLVPWQALANANSNFLLTERRRHYLRYLGALTFFEINGPSVYKAYLAAGRRCGLSERACGYWELHIKEDERHGRQMLDEVALPLAAMYPDNAGEVLLGYEQEAFLGARAGAAVTEAIRAAEAAAERAASAGQV